jgi:WD40 repeat protein
LFTARFVSPPPDYAFSADWRQVLTMRGQSALVFMPSDDPALLPGWLEGDFIAPETTVFLTPDGKTIGYITPLNSSSNTTRLELRDVRTQQHIAEWALPGHVEAMTISHDGKWLVLGSNKGYDSQIIFLDLTHDLTQVLPLVRSLNHPNFNGDTNLIGLTFSPDDSHLAVEGYHAVCGDNCVYFDVMKTWDVSRLIERGSLAELSSLTIDAVHTPIFSQDGQLLLVTSIHGFNDVVYAGSMQLWDTARHQQLKELSGDDGIGAFSPDGRLLVIHQSDHTALYDTDALSPGNIIPVAILEDRDKPITELAFNPEGTILYVVSENRLWLYAVGG